MSDKRIVVGSDHAGLALKYELLLALAGWGWAAEDLGAFPLHGAGAELDLDRGTGTLRAPGSVDYPGFAFEVGRRVAAGQAPLGMLICGSGIGMSIAANKVPGVRAALCHDPCSAELARAHNDANVLCMGGRIIGPELGKAVLKAFLDGRFAGDRHQRRINQITAAERRARGDDR